MNKKLIRSVFYDDPQVLAMLDAKDREELAEKVNEKTQPEIAVLLKGDKGDSPTDEHLVSLFEPIIPELTKGEAGYTPIKGVDYFDGEDGQNGTDGRDGKDGRDGTNGKDGKGADVLDLDKIFDDFIEKIQKKKVLDISHIRNASSFMKDGIKYKIEELMHGGSETLQAGSNVTITHSNGTATINASGAALAIIPVTGTIDDSNVTFTSATLPTLLNINGAFYQQTGGSITWSRAGITITLSSPVGTNGTIFGI